MSIHYNSLPLYYAGVQVKMVGTKKQDYSLFSGHKRNEITETLSNISPNVRESKTDTRLHTVIFVSGPWILDSGFQSLLVSEIPDTLSCISDSKTQVSGFHKQGLRILDHSFTWCEKMLIKQVIIEQIKLLTNEALEYGEPIIDR